MWCRHRGPPLRALEKRVCYFFLLILFSLFCSITVIQGGDDNGSSVGAPRTWLQYRRAHDTSTSNVIYIQDCIKGVMHCGLSAAALLPIFKNDFSARDHMSNSPFWWSHTSRMCTHALTADITEAMCFSSAANHPALHASRRTLNLISHSSCRVNHMLIRSLDAQIFPLLAESLFTRRRDHELNVQMRAYVFHSASTRGSE